MGYARQFKARPAPRMRYAPHPFVASRVDPQACVVCPLPKGNRVHGDDVPDLMDVRLASTGERIAA